MLGAVAGGFRLLVPESGYLVPAFRPISSASGLWRRWCLCFVHGNGYLPAADNLIEFGIIGIYAIRCNCRI